MEGWKPYQWIRKDQPIFFLSEASKDTAQKIKRRKKPLSRLLRNFEQPCSMLHD